MVDPWLHTCKWAISPTCDPSQACTRNLAKSSCLEIEDICQSFLTIPWDQRDRPTFASDKLFSSENFIRIWSQIRKLTLRLCFGTKISDLRFLSRVEFSPITAISSLVQNSLISTFRTVKLRSVNSSCVHILEKSKLLILHIFIIESQGWTRNLVISYSELAVKIIQSGFILSDSA